MNSPLLLLAASVFAWQDTGGRMELREGGNLVLAYNYGPQLRAGAPADRQRCCYIFPLLTPAGVSVLDDFPEDHWHHRGLFWAWPVVEVAGKAHDLWMFKDMLHRAEGKPQATVNRDEAALTLTNAWYAGPLKVVRESVRLRVFAATGVARELEVTLVLEAVGQAVTLRGAPEAGKSYGGFSARFAPRSGTVLRADGVVLSQDEDLNTRGWAELEGTFGGRRALLRITPQAGADAQPHQWCLRHYGFVGASFPGKTDTVQGYRLVPGKPLTLRYRVRAADVS